MKDYCSKQGARHIESALASYWFLRTGDPGVIRTDRIETAAPMGEGYKAHTSVRSDMINGLPRGYVWRNGKLVRSAANAA